jgi:hypothetical protein
MTPVIFSSRSFGAVVAALALSFALGACGGGKKHSDDPSSTSSPKALAVKTSVLKVGSVDVQSAGPSKPIDAPTAKAVLDTAQAYIDNAVFTPLEDAKLGKGYAALFDAGVRPGATGADVAALTDLNVGKVTIVSTKATPVHLSTLEGTLGETMYLATDFDIDVKAKNDAGPLTIHRHIELTFAKSGKPWLVTGYRVQAVRKTPKATTTTTATGGAKP